MADGEIVDGADLQMNIINNSPEQKWGLYDPDKLYGIMGETFTNVQQMAAYYKSRTAHILTAIRMHRLLRISAGSILKSVK